jgi:hypothetical protein
MQVDFSKPPPPPRSFAFCLLAGLYFFLCGRNLT